jgi:hypothetical protein
MSTEDKSAKLKEQFEKRKRAQEELARQKQEQERIQEELKKQVPVKLPKPEKSKEELAQEKEAKQIQSEEKKKQKELKEQAKEEQRKQAESSQKTIENTIKVQVNEICKNLGEYHNQIIDKIEKIEHGKGEVEKRYHFATIDELKELKGQITDLKTQTTVLQATVNKFESMPHTETAQLDPELQKQFLASILEANKKLVESVAAQKQISPEQLQVMINAAVSKPIKPEEKTYEDYQYEVALAFLADFRNSFNKAMNTWRLANAGEMSRNLGIKDSEWFKKNVYKPMRDDSYLLVLPEVKDSPEGKGSYRDILTPKLLEKFRTRIDADLMYGLNQKLGTQYFIDNLVDEKGNYIKENISKLVKTRSRQNIKPKKKGH